MSKNTFSYDQIENIDSLFNYLNTLNKGLKDRHISFGNDKDLLEFSLPEEVRFKIEAKAKRKSASISVDIKWNLPVDSNKKDCGSKKVINSKKNLLRTGTFQCHPIYYRKKPSISVTKSACPLCNFMHETSSTKGSK